MLTERLSGQRLEEPRSQPGGGHPPGSKPTLGGTASGLRIMVLNYEFPPVGGGGGRIAADFCRHLVKLGHRVLVQTSWHPSLPRREERDGYEIVRHLAGRRRLHTCSVPEMAAYLALTWLPTWRTTLAWRPQVLQVHFAVPTGVLGWLMARGTGLPYVLSAHLGDVPGGVPEQTEHLFRWLKPFTRPIWRSAAAVTAPARHIKVLAERHYGVPVSVLPNGIDLEQFPCRPAPPGEPLRLIFVGRLSIQKNPLLLLQALGLLRDLPWRLDILGDGPLRPAAEALARELGLAPRVVFHGWVRPEAVPTAMCRSDVLVLPSLAEGLPLVGVQALAAGLAIVGSNVGGIADVIRPGQNGLLVPVNDAAALAAALRQVLDRRVAAAWKQGSRDLAPAFDLQAAARLLEDLLKKAAAQGRCYASLC